MIILVFFLLTSIVDVCLFPFLCPFSCVICGNDAIGPGNVICATKHRTYSGEKPKYGIYVGVRASNKKPDVDIGDKARSIKSKFENGEVYREEQNHSAIQIDDSAVFEHGKSL